MKTSKSRSVAAVMAVALVTIGAAGIGLTFGGACTAETDPTGVGPTGPGECADVQFAVHQP